MICLVDGVIPLLNNWDQVFTVVVYFCLVCFFFRCLTPQKFIDVIFSSLGYCFLQNLRKALPSVNYRPAAQFFPFYVFPALSSA